MGKSDERDLFPEALRLVDECRPRAVLLENVRGFLDATFEDYRRNLKQQLEKMGYIVGWKLLNSSDFGVSQLSPESLLLPLKENITKGFPGQNH